MSKRIIYTNPDGSCSIIIPAPNCGLTIEQIAAKDVPSGCTYEIVDTSAIPSDRSFRNAWEQDTSVTPEKIKVNFIKAQEITKNRLRKERTPLFTDLDVQFQKNSEKGTDNTTVVAEKNRLRDITKLPDS